MRIDAHGHGMHADRDAAGKFLPPLKHGWVSGAQTPKDYVEGCRQRGVEGVVLLDPAHVAFGLKEIFGDFVIPVPMVDIDAITPQEIDALLSQGAAGIKFICPMHSYGDKRYFPLYDVIGSRGALAVFHTGYLSDTLFKPGALMPRKDVVDITDMRPAAIDHIARAFGDLKILMAHFGNPWFGEAWNTMRNFKNVYADISGGTAHRLAMAMWTQLFTLDERPDYNSIGKLCFASDSSFCFQGIYDFRGHIDFYERFYEAMKVPAELREKIDRGNIRALVARGK